MFRVGLPADRVALQFQAVRPCRVAEQDWAYRSESCVRIVDAKGQLIRAGEFIATAKRLGALQLLDRVVVEKVMQRIATEGPVRGGATAVNLSVETIMTRLFVDWLHGKLAAQAGRAPSSRGPEHATSPTSDRQGGILRPAATPACGFDRRFGQSTPLSAPARLEVDYFKIDAATRGAFIHRPSILRAGLWASLRPEPSVIIEYSRPSIIYELARPRFACAGLLIGRPE